MLHRNSINKFFNKDIALLFFLYLTLLISFYLGENSTGGAIKDYISQKKISLLFVDDFLGSLLNYDQFSQRHAPSLVVFLSIFEKFNVPDFLIRLIHLHICLLLPIFFFQALKVRYPNLNYKILILINSLIWISPTFRSLAIWPDSRLFGLMFFTLAIVFFLKFENEKKFKFVISNIIFTALSSYFSPNFSVFSIFFLLKFISYYELFSRQIIYALILNLILSFPAIYYIFVLDINFMVKSATIGMRENDSIFFNNFYNDLLITFTIIFFYLTPFIIFKVIKIDNLFKYKNIILSILIFLICINYFDYNYSYSGGGIFFKTSNFIFGNNYLFFLISFISISFIVPILTNNKFNFILFILIILNNPQYTIYHKYFDPFLIIVFFTILSLRMDLKKLIYKNNFLYIFSYFLVFLMINNLKIIWIT